jgi:F0F1-type ATP synthase assembly protein I
MTDGQPPKRPDEAAGANMGWTAVGYLLAGMAVWGSIGWLVDQWLVWNGIATAIGIIVGMAGAIYLIVRRLGI